MKNCHFIYGNYFYEYQLIRSNRKTLSLTVYPDLSIVLKSPVAATIERIEQFLKRKWPWLEKQLRFFKRYKKKTYQKEYLSGESFFYLGRQYKLKIRRTNINNVALSKGVLNLYTKSQLSDHVQNKALLDTWYSGRTKIVFKKRYKHVLTNFNFDLTPDLVIRKMSKRWGSFYGQKKIILNPKLIHASTDCIDYVITHELCHMDYLNHSKDFYKLLEKKFPNWQQVKEKLELKFS